VRKKSTAPIPTDLKRRKGKRISPEKLVSMHRRQGRIQREGTLENRKKGESSGSDKERGNKVTHSKHQKRVRDVKAGDAHQGAKRGPIKTMTKASLMCGKKKRESSKGGGRENPRSHHTPGKPEKTKAGDKGLRWGIRNLPLKKGTGHPKKRGLLMKVPGEKSKVKKSWGGVVTRRGTIGKEGARTIYPLKKGQEEKKSANWFQEAVSGHRASTLVGKKSLGNREVRSDNGSSKGWRGGGKVGAKKGEGEREEEGVTKINTRREDKLDSKKSKRDRLIWPTCRGAGVEGGAKKKKRGKKIVTRHYRSICLTSKRNGRQEKTSSLQLTASKTGIDRKVHWEIGNLRGNTGSGRTAQRLWEKHAKTPKTSKS